MWHETLADAGDFIKQKSKHHQILLNFYYIIGETDAGYTTEVDLSGKTKAEIYILKLLFCILETN